MLCYQVLKSGKPYQERGMPPMDQTQRDRLICHHVRRLGKLGIRVRSLTLPEDSKKAKPKKVPADSGKPKTKKARAKKN